jgi:hypothetical protein
MRIKDFGVLPKTSGATNPAQAAVTGSDRVSTTRATSAGKRRATTASRAEDITDAYYAACPFSINALAASGIQTDQWLIDAAGAAAAQGASVGPAYTRFAQANGLLRRDVNPAWADGNSSLFNMLLKRMGVSRDIEAARTIQSLVIEGQRAIDVAREIMNNPSGSMAQAATAVFHAEFPCSDEEGRIAQDTAEAAGEAERARKEQEVKDQLARNAAEEARRAGQREAYRAAVKTWAEQMRAWRAGEAAPDKSPLGMAAALAAAGFLVGGPVGAAAGGVVGLLTGGSKTNPDMPPVQPGRPDWMAQDEAASIVVSVMGELTVQ